MSDATHGYEPPVDKLLTLGRPDTKAELTRSVEGLGLTPEHVPDLIRMARDWRALGDVEYADEDDEPPIVYAAIHAWRGLGLLAAQEAAQPLLEVLEDRDADGFDDWSVEEIPVVLGMIGPAAVAPIERFIVDRGKDPGTRGAAARALVEIANRFPESRERCVDGLSLALSAYETDDPEFNGFLVGYLLDLKAVEAAPILRRALKAERVEEWIAGGWRDVREALKLEPTPDDPPDRPRKANPDFLRYAASADPFDKRAQAERDYAKRKAEAKARRRRAKDAKRRNRRKK
jgi:hypothetical protein